MAYRNWRIGYTRLLQSYLLGNISRSYFLENATARFILLRNDIGNGGIFLSDENLLGPPPGHFFAKCLGRQRSFYSASDVVFEAVKEAYGNDIEKVVLVKRDVTRLVLSLYRDMIGKMRVAEDLESFISALDPGFFEVMDDCYNNALTQFGEAANILEFEDVVGDVSATIKSLGFSATLNENKNSNMNQSMGWRSTEMALQMSPLLRSDEERRAFRYWLSKNIGEGDCDLGLRAKGMLENRVLERRLMGGVKG